MKHIERYLSAYVMYCLFGGEKNAHMEYIMHTIRESTSVTNHPVLSKVQDYVHQGDPANPEIMEEVRAYVSDLIKGGVLPQVISYKALISKKQGAIIITVVDNDNKPIALGMAKEVETEKAFAELRQMFPGIEFVNEV